MSFKLLNEPRPPCTEDLFLQFQNKYSKEAILDANRGFQWGKVNPDTAIENRRKIANEFQSWVRNGCPEDKAEYHADRVMKWGFNRKSPESLTNNIGHFCNLINCWNKEEDHEQMHALLTENLNLRGIGIARSSKWLCFIDESRFCIYDSRVSAALRHITYGNQQVFPTVPGRSANSQTILRETSRMDKRMVTATDYFRFLNLMRLVAQEYQIERVGDIEMGLFMLGNDPSNG